MRRTFLIRPRVAIRLKALAWLKAPVILVTAAILALGAGCAKSPDSSSGLPPVSAGPESASTLPTDIMPEDRIQTDEEVDRTPDGLVRVRAPESRGAVFVKPPRPHLQRYTGMLLEPATISYREYGRRFPENVQNRLQKGFRQDLLTAISAGPAWKQVVAPGPNVLLVRVAIADVDIEPGRGGSGSAVSFVVASGGAIVAFELADSLTREPLFRYIERRALPSGVYGGGDIDRTRLAKVFSQFAQDVGDALRFHHAVIREIEKREREGPH